MLHTSHEGHAASKDHGLHDCAGSGQAPFKKTQCCGHMQNLGTQSRWRLPTGPPTGSTHAQILIDMRPYHHKPFTPTGTLLFRSCKIPRTGTTQYLQGHAACCPAALPQGQCTISPLVLGHQIWDPFNTLEKSSQPGPTLSRPMFPIQITAWAILTNC